MNMNMRAASAPLYLPLIPTPYRTEGEVDFRTKTELEHHTKTDLGGQTKTSEGLPYTEAKTIQNRPDDNRGHYIPPRIEYETDNARQPKTNVGLELHTDMVGNTQNNINPTPHQANQMVTSSMQVPFNFTDHQHRDNVRGGLNILKFNQPNLEGGLDLTIHEEDVGPVKIHV